MSEWNHLQKLQNVVTRKLATTSDDTDNRPLLYDLGLEKIKNLVDK